MKKTLLFALAALPLCAQDAAPAPAPEVPATAVQPARRQHPEITPEQREAIKAKMLEKFDTNKDGQLDDAEKEAVKAEMAKHHKGGKPGMHRPHGDRPAMSPEQREAMKAKMLEKFDTNKDGQLDDAEKAAMKAEFAKHHQGGRHQGHGHGMRGQCPQQAPAPQAR